MMKNIISVVERKNMNGKFNEPLRKDLYDSRSISDAQTCIQRCGMVPEYTLEMNHVDIYSNVANLRNSMDNKTQEKVLKVEQTEIPFSKSIIVKNEPIQR